MSLLSKAKRGVTQDPTICMVYGPTNIGKTSFGADAPNPIILDLEKSAGAFDRFKLSPASWEEYLQTLQELCTDPHDYQSVVTDTADKLEYMIMYYVCRRDHGTYVNKQKEPLNSLIDGVPNPAAYGFGTCGDYIANEFAKAQLLLERLRVERKMNVIFLAHKGMYKERRGADPDFQKVGPKLMKQMRERITEWCDDMFFAYKDLKPVEAPKNDWDFNRRWKFAQDGNVHRMLTSDDGAHLAKNRWRMPNIVDLSWDEYAHHVRKYREDTVSTRRAIEEVIAEISAKLETYGNPATTEYMNKLVSENRNNLVKLVNYSNKLSAKLVEKAGLHTATSPATEAGPQASPQTSEMDAPAAS